MKEYKYWFYYLKDKKTDKYYLYAYSNDKTTSDLFEYQRNMSKFHIKVKAISKEDVHYFAENHQCKILEAFPIEVYDRDSNEKFTTLYALTTTEKLNYLHMDANVPIMIYKNAWTNPLIFKKDIQKALFDLDYYKYFLNLAETIEPNAKRKFDKKIVENIRQMCEDGGFNPYEQEDYYFDSYVNLIAQRLPNLEENIIVDRLAILVKCIKDTL